MDHHPGGGQQPHPAPPGEQRPNPTPITGSIPRRQLPPGEPLPNPTPLTGSIPRRMLPPIQQPLGRGYPLPPPHMMMMMSPGYGGGGPATGYGGGPPPAAAYPPQPYARAQQPPSSANGPPSLPDHIPRKKNLPPRPVEPARTPREESARTPRPARERPSHIAVKSENPFVIRIKSKDLAMLMGLPKVRSSGRAPKRKRPTYEELRDTDSDDFMSDDEEEEYVRKKRLHKAKKQQPSESSDFVADDVYMTDVVVGVDAIDSPPPGTLSTLWYSREVFLNLFVLEKIIGWKTRPIIKLEWQDVNDIKILDPQEAASISSKLLLDQDFWTNRVKRMEVSRINPGQCPVVLAAAAAKEGRKEQPRYVLAPTNADEREEVLLVKWRGRSYVHCSWERRKDLEKFDQSNNTAKNKIRRYVQNQEVTLGKDWKKILEAERASSNKEAADEMDEEEEFFPPQYLEVERILACDENEMNMQVLAKQRALNLRKDQENLRLRDEEEAKVEASGEGGETLHHAHKALKLFDDLPVITDGEAPWDPEDNVRYVVKWKGLQYSEMTWEYWRDIKRDAVDEAEDFWYRQKAPSASEVSKIVSRPHPHVRDFKKLLVSPEFAVSHKARPVAPLDGMEEIKEAEDDDDEKEASKAFQLRSYQLEGVNWLLFNWFNKRSCILADEMGLGKTIQSVAFLHQLHELPSTQVRGPFLIVAPLSLIAQWQSESQTWAPDLNIVFYHGSADARDFLVQQEFYYTEQFVPKTTAMKLKKQHITKFDILITTYEVVLKDIAVLSRIRWKALIVDEAHRLKNVKARLFEELATVPREFCLLLTGTPLQNSTEELWALLHFADPVAFKSKDDFIEKFGQLTDAKQVSDLHSILKPYLLRRVKEDVEKALPPKEETILEVTLTPTQKTYYKAIYERNTAFLFKGAKPSNAPSLMNIMMELRKCCNHPFLVRGAEDRILSEAAASMKETKDENGNVIPIDYLKLFGDQLVKSSGKMVLLSKLLPKLYAGGHKVLIFSQMVRVLDLLAEFLKIKKYRYERLDGSTTASARTAAVDRFHRKSCQRFVMLLSTRAGGLGLNLTAADIVIIFDSDWNPQNDLQAMARAHRIGQTRAVSVYRLLTAKTYEMHMFHSASLKLGLDRAVLAHQRQQGNDDSEESNKTKSKSDREVQAKEIDELLKKGAYDVFRDDDDTEAQKFMETDIDQLLERSAKKVTYGDANASSMSSGLGSFSKASFVADTGDGGKDVDLDDPNFWEKAVGLDVPVETPAEIAAMIDDGVKRSRKQVQQFDPYAAFAEAEQKKKSKVEQKAKEEKEERQRLRLEKKRKRMEEKERKKRERAEARGRPSNKGPESQEDEAETEDDGAKAKDIKSKISKKAERRRAQKRAEIEDPAVERLKQAWEVPQRNRATSAALRFGFDRFCKLRNESNLTSLPIQDLEVFFRSYIYQLSLQVAVTLLSMLHSKVASSSTVSSELQIRHLLRKWLGWQSDLEVEWICRAIHSVMRMQIEVEEQRRDLRLPLVLVETSYIAELRKGSALRALRRVHVLSRLNYVIENALDDILTSLRHEELGKRGCSSTDLTALDADLKARYVTTEELALALSSRLSSPNTDYEPCTWWDRSCDIGLLIGTFVHGFGNYEAMRSDDELPFAEKIRCQERVNQACIAAYLSFHAAARAARAVFGKALDSARSKAQEEAHAVVAAAVAHTQSGADLKPSSEEIIEAMPSNESDSDDTHLVTLGRLSMSMLSASHTEASRYRILSANGGDAVPIKTVSSSSDEGKGSNDEYERTEKEKLPLDQQLPMPDARVLDNCLIQLICRLESESTSEAHDLHNESTSVDREAGQDVIAHEEVRIKGLATVLGMTKERIAKERRDFIGIGFNGAQCAATHRSLDDGSDYGVGAASAELSYVATGTDAPRYLRALGVPMNITRYAASALLYADGPTLETMLSEEEIRNSLEVAGKPGEENDGAEPDEAAKKNASKEKDKAISAEAGETPEKVASKEEKVEATVSEVDITPGKVSSELATAEQVGRIVMDPVFRENASLRAAICATALHYGFTTLMNGDALADAAVSSTLERFMPPSDTARSRRLFSLNEFSSASGSLANQANTAPPEAVKEYVETILLPYCLRLCVMGNGPTTRNAREGRGKFETAFGINEYPDYTKPLQSPLPDPCAPLGEQSIEAVACASAILRRTRLMRAVQHIVSGGVALDRLKEILKSDIVRNSMQDLPVWWCPDIHDLGLLMHAAARGLFTILGDRKEGLTDSVFCPEAIIHHIRTRVISGLPKHVMATASPEDVTTWVQDQSQQFPSANALERRLALLCEQATADMEGSNVRYDNLPMFDHGGWPRN